MNEAYFLQRSIRKGASCEAELKAACSKNTLLIILSA
jgi:hypothetical protein